LDGESGAVVRVGGQELGSPSYTTHLERMVSTSHDRELEKEVLLVCLLPADRSDSYPATGELCSTFVIGAMCMRISLGKRGDLTVIGL